MTGDVPYCPYCYSEYEFCSESHNILGNLSTVLVDCLDCKNKFRLDVDMAPQFTTKELPCINDGVKHSWHEYKSMPHSTTHYHYKKCGWCDKVEDLCHTK